MESNRLESRIAALRSQVRRILAFHGLSKVMALLILATLALGGLDWLLNLDRSVRVAALTAWIALALWSSYRYVLIPLVVRFADLDIALRIEERWPGLNDRLASTVQFLKLPADDDRFGSAALREATIRETLQETEGIDFREVLEARPARRSLGVAGSVLLLGLAVYASSPTLSSLALKRLFQPFGSNPWPQQTHLTLVDRETPRKVARGEPFALAVQTTKGDVVPRSAEVAYRFANGTSSTEKLRAVEGGLFRGRLEMVEHDFTFSVSAGDDHNSIRDVKVRVVPPPTLKSVQIRLIPPEYTALAPYTLAPGNNQVRAVEGTRVELQAEADKPLTSALMHQGEAAKPQPLTIDASGRRFNASLVVANSFPLWFALRDREGFANRDAPRIEVRSIQDESPRVVLNEPSSDRDVPAKAVVPIRFTVDDDYGIKSARVLYKTSAGGSEPTEAIAIPLWDAHDLPPDRRSKHQELSYEWDLAPLKLPSGSVITFHAEALDVDDLKGPHLGKSREIRLRVVSDEEINRQFDDQRREIREETARILEMQKQAQIPVSESIRKLDETGGIDQPSRDDLKNAEMIQRQVGSRLTSRSEGLGQKIQRLLDDMKNFKTASVDAQKQMEEMSAGIESLRDQHLGAVEQDLTHASKNLEQTPPENGDNSVQKPQAPAASKNEQASTSGSSTQKASEGSGNRKAAPKSEKSEAKPGSPSSEKNDPAPPAKPEPKTQENRFAELARKDLEAGEQHQKAVGDSLQKMLDNLSEFETYRGVVKEAQDLLKQQEQMMKQAAEAAAKPELMGKTPETLAPNEKADLGNLADRQRQVARGLQNLQEQMEEMAKRLDESDPLGAAALRETAEQSRKQGTSSRMGETAEQLAKNQMGEAKAGQEQAREDLKELVDSIQNRRERELARFVKELKNAEAALKNLKQRQAENLKNTKQAGQIADAKQRADALKKLAKEQAEIQKELNKQLKKLAKLNAEGAAQSGSRASARMSKAESDLEQDQGEQAGEEQEEALADLEEAEEQVAEARKQLEEQLAMEQLFKMTDELKSLAERQAKMVTDIDGYEKGRAERQGSLTIAQRSGVRGLGRVQEGLKEETSGLTEKLEGAPVFALTLKRAEDAMDRSAQGLLSLKTNDETQRHAKAAAHRFQQLLDSLKQDKPKAGGGQGGGGGDGGGGGGGDGIPPAAQLKMLKALQEEINDRTEYFDELRRRNRELTQGQNEELERLETDQGTLADLARDLTRPKKTDGED